MGLKVLYNLQLSDLKDLDSLKLLKIARLTLWIDKMLLIYIFVSAFYIKLGKKKYAIRDTLMSVRVI